MILNKFLKKIKTASFDVVFDTYVLDNDKTLFNYSIVNNDTLKIIVHENFNNVLNNNNIYESVKMQIKYKEKCEKYMDILVIGMLSMLLMCTNYLLIFRILIMRYRDGTCLMLSTLLTCFFAKCFNCDLKK